MELTLSLDLGNTRLKWWIDSTNEVAEGAIDNRALESGLRGLPWAHIREIRIASVRDPSVTMAVASLVDSLSAPHCSVNLVTVTHCPDLLALPNTNLQQIGVDRFLAMLAVSDVADVVIVIDAGTALTIDVIEARVHQGGYILPGYRLGWDVLAGQTDRIQRPRDAMYSATLDPGLVTATCVEHGIRLSLIATCQAVLARYQHQGALAVVITGGDGQWLAGHLPEPVRYDSALVKRGMDRYFVRPS